MFLLMPLPDYDGRAVPVRVRRSAAGRVGLGWWRRLGLGLLLAPRRLRPPSPCTLKAFGKWALVSGCVCVVVDSTRVGRRCWRRARAPTLVRAARRRWVCARPWAMGVCVCTACVRRAGLRLRQDSC